MAAWSQIPDDSTGTRTHSEYEDRPDGAYFAAPAAQVLSAARTSARLLGSIGRLLNPAHAGRLDRSVISTPGIRDILVPLADRHLGFHVRQKTR